MASRAMVDAHIMVIDDERSNVVLISSMLHRAGYTRVDGFTDPRAALQSALKNEPDLVLLDLHMPELNGLAFLEALRRPRPSSEFNPVLVLTADDSREALRSALRAGASDYATKPVDIDELLLRVHNLLSMRLCHEELKRHNITLTTELRTRAQYEDAQAADRGYKIHTMRTIIDRGGPEIVFQPIVELATGSTLGVEALARFSDDLRRDPDQVFTEAASVGLGAELELSAITAALRQRDQLNANWILALNISPATMFTSEFQSLLDDWDLHGLSFEITEHQPIADYQALNRVTEDLRARGALITVDDAGAGYASFRHILKLNPDVIKLDITLTRDINLDPVKRALAASLERFAEDVGAAITAEGIETAAELDTLRQLGIHYGQGDYIAQPAPVEHDAAADPPPSLVASDACAASART